MNHLCYADDMVVFAPSASGLRKLLQICELYAKQHDVIYNAKKTVCMVVRPKRLQDLRSLDITLDKKVLRYVNTYKYLGVMITSNMNDDIDIMRQVRSVYARAHSLLRKFTKCTFEVKRVLFQAYCLNMYCAQLWCNYTKYTMNKLRVAYNNCLRMFLGYSRYCSASGMCVENDLMSFDELIRKSVYGFWNRVNSNQNILVKYVSNCTYLWAGAIHNEWRAKLYTAR
jgi:hypothetical protein